MGSVLDKIWHSKERVKIENPNHLDPREPVKQKEMKRKVGETNDAPKVLLIA